MTFHHPFEPVPVRPRHDGWTAKKQIAFIEALAETCCVEDAARRVGMSDTSAYALRRRSCAWSFRRAWDAAMDYSAHLLVPAAYGRSLKGVPRPIFHKGEQVGEWRHFDERLTMFLLRTRFPHRFGKWIDQAPAPVRSDELDPDRDAGLLEAQLDEVAERAPAKDGYPESDWPEEWPED